MKVKLTVLSCNAPTVRVVAGNENGQTTTDVEPGKSVEIEGQHIRIDAGPDNRDLTEDERADKVEADKARAAADAKAKK